MVALFLDDNKTNDDANGKKIGKKWYVYINKQQNNGTVVLYNYGFRDGLRGTHF